MSGEVKRIIKDKIFTYSVVILVLISLIPLFLILFQIIINGIRAFSPSILIHTPVPPGEKGGGILNAITGTILLVTLASLWAIPSGIMLGVFIAETRNKLSSLLSVSVNIFQGIPSIVTGLIAYLLLVKPFGSFSALSGSFALGLIMLPVVTKSTEESLKLIPHELKEAAQALGASYTRTMVKIILPGISKSILSGSLIATGRIIGETAPLLFTAFGNPFVNLNPFKPVDALPLVIFNYAMSPYEEWHRISWTASLILITFVLTLNIISKGVQKR